MTTEEFSDEFDALVDAYSLTMPFGMSLDPPHFNEYEKSLFLTKALELLVITYYSDKIGSEAFETTEEVRRYLDLLVKTLIITDKVIISNSIQDRFKHSIYKLPEDLWFIIYELAKYLSEDPCLKDFNAEIIPCTHDGYYRTILNPFRGPSRRRVLRLDQGETNVELVSKYELASYMLRYIARPTPIILTDLSNLTINGFNEKMTCILHTALHRRILEMGVLLALASRVRESNKDKDK